MTTIALIFSTPSTAFSAYTVVSDLCEVIAVSSTADAGRIDVPVQAVFVEASMLTKKSVAALRAQFPPLTTRVFVLLDPEVPMFEVQGLGLNDVTVIHGPLTTTLAAKCLVGIPGIRLPNDHPSFLMNSANDRT